MSQEQTPYLADYAAKQAADELAQIAVPARQQRTWRKEAAGLDLSGLKDVLTNMNPTAQSALVGAGLGAGVGGLSSLGREKGRRQPFRNMLVGALGGGALAGGGAMALNSTTGRSLVDSLKKLPSMAADPGGGSAVDDQTRELMNTYANRPALNRFVEGATGAGGKAWDATPGWLKAIAGIDATSHGLGTAAALAGRPATNVNHIRRMLTALSEVKNKGQKQKLADLLGVKSDKVLRKLFEGAAEGKMTTIPLGAKEPPIQLGKDLAREITNQGVGGTVRPGLASGLAKSLGTRSPRLAGWAKWLHQLGGKAGWKGRLGGRAALYAGVPALLALWNASLENTAMTDQVARAIRTGKAVTMEKIINAADWDFGETSAAIVKMASDGRLLGGDYRVLVKRAGEEFASRVRDVQVNDDQIPVHVIAMGSTEAYGPNRNGDGFKEATLKSTYKTFEKHAKAYRHHKNKDPKKCYGQVKLAVYNDAMRRVELLLALNRTKEAAEKYGGFVADKEQETLESGKDLGVSMACSVAFDECSSCNNKARSRKQYCDEDSCISPSGEKRGGCKSHLTKVCADGHILHVDNPEPRFFDISSVFRPADRIAYGNVADYMQKAASGEVLGGAALAEAYGVSPPLDVTLAGIADQRLAQQIKLAYQLAELEDRESTGDLNLLRAVDPAQRPQVDLRPAGAFGSTKMASGLAALASQKVALPLRDFLRLAGHKDDVVDLMAVKVAQALPGSFSRLISSGNLEEKLRHNPFSPSQNLAPAYQRAWATKLASDFSLDRTAVQQRIWKSAINAIECPTLLQQMDKQASDLGDEELSLAQSYALYKLAFLSTVTNDVQLTSELLISENYIRS